jgi:Fcf2 pre-rRNA processing
MRGVLDPKRFYKNPGKFKIPEYSQVGTLIEGPTEFFNARLTKKERKRTFVEEALAGEAETGRLKKKYEDIMEKKRSGRKEWYKAQRARRKAGIGK